MIEDEKKIHHNEPIHSSIVGVEKKGGVLNILLNNAVVESLNVDENAIIIKSMESSDEILMFVISPKVVKLLDIYFPESGAGGVRVDVSSVNHGLKDVRHADAFGHTALIASDDSYAIISSNGSFMSGKCDSPMYVRLISEKQGFIVAKDGIHLIDIENKVHLGISVDQLAKFGLAVDDFVGGSVYVGRYKGRDVFMVSSNKDLAIVVNVNGRDMFSFYIIKNPRTSFDVFKRD